MNCEKTIKDNQTVLSCSGELSIYEADAFKAELLNCMSETDDFVLDLGGVTGCDSAGFQVLMALRNSALQQGKNVEMINPSDSITGTAEQIGFDWQETTSRAQENENE